MSNWIDLQLDVLSPEAAESQRIKVAINKPGEQLLAWAADHWDWTFPEMLARVSRMLTFRTSKTANSSSSREGRGLRLESEYLDRFSGLVMTHILSVSEAFPESVFLLLRWDFSLGFAAKTVIRAGTTVCGTSDDHQPAHGGAWALPDIFEPYRLEDEECAAFGLFFNPWLTAMEEALSLLRKCCGKANGARTREGAASDWEERFELASAAIESSE